MTVRNAVQLAESAARNMNDKMARAQYAEAIKLLGKEITTLQKEIEELKNRSAG